MVLLTVLVVVTVLSLAAWQYSDMMLSEYQAADNTVRNTQARAFAESGVQYAAALLSDPSNLAGVLQSNPWDNPGAFKDVIVQANDKLPRFQGRFSVIAPPVVDPSAGIAGAGSFTFGVTDESSKLNINALLKIDPSGQTAFNALMMLPNMTEDVADAIIDWIDRDDTPRTSGAEDATYSALNPSYQAKNGPLDTIDELLLVQNMTWQLFYGTDLHRNGQLDPGEGDGTGLLDPGLGYYLTPYTREFNVDSQGTPRTYVNGNNLKGIYDKLSSTVGQDLATFIVLYRQYGTAAASADGNSNNKGGNKGGKSSGTSGTSATAAASSSAPATTSATPATATKATTGGSNAAATKTVNGTLTGAKLDFTKAGKTQVASLYDLIGASVTVPGQQAKDPATRYTSPLDPSNLETVLPALLDAATAQKQRVMPGRVNVNTASQTVLNAVPGMTPDLVQAIVGARPQPTDLATADAVFQSPAWLMLRAGLKASQMKQIEQYVTTRTQVYRVQVLGYFDEGPTFARVEAVIDANGGRPRVLYVRDISELGKGFDLSQGQ